MARFASLFLGLILVFLSSQLVFASSEQFDEVLGEGIQLLKGSQFERALEKFRAAEKIDSSSSLLYGLKAETLLKLKEGEEALRNTDKAIALGYTAAVIYSIRARCFILLKDYDAAWIDAERAKSLGDDTADIHMVYGVLYTEKKEVKKALLAFEQALERKPEYKPVTQEFIRMNKGLFKPYFEKHLPKNKK